jgi:hypothetical protein
MRTQMMLGNSPRRMVSISVIFTIQTPENRRRKKAARVAPGGLASTNSTMA